MKKKEERMEKQMNEIMAENKRLTEPLQKAREEVEELRKQVRSNGYIKFLPLFRLDLGVKNLTQLSLPLMQCIMGRIYCVLARDWGQVRLKTLFHPLARLSLVLFTCSTLVLFSWCFVLVFYFNFFE